MEQQLTGILLQVVPISDRKSVCRVFTREAGLRGFIPRAGKGARPILQPMNRIRFQSRLAEGKGLLPLREPELRGVWHRVSLDPARTCVALFMNELLVRTLRDDYVNESLFDFIDTTLDLLDEEERIGHIPLWFVLGLAGMYGFHPRGDEEGGAVLRGGLSPEEWQGLKEAADWSYSEIRVRSFAPGAAPGRLRSAVSFLFAHAGGNPSSLHSLDILAEVLRG